MRLLAIDPGPTQSAYVVVDNSDLRPLFFDKIPNEEMLKLSHLGNADCVVIEMIGHYGTGMPAGKDVFDTCVWIGRFWQVADGFDKEFERFVGVAHQTPVDLVKRATVKAHLCGAAKAKDGNVIQALVDRFAPGVRNKGKGVKSDPGWFYDFHSDIWQAYGLAVYYADIERAMIA